MIQPPKFRSLRARDYPGPFVWPCFLFIIQALHAAPFLPFQQDTGSLRIPWEHHGPEGQPQDPALSGIVFDDSGFSIGPGLRGANVCAIAEDHPALCFAFSMRIDTTAALAARGLSVRFFESSLVKSPRAFHPTTFLTATLFAGKGGFAIRWLFRPSADSSRNRSVISALRAGRACRVEAFHRLFGDSVACLLLLDGDTALHFKDSYFLGHEYYLAGFGNIPDSLQGLRLRITDAMLSRTRTFPRPSAPNGLRDTLWNGLPLLLCDSFKTHYKGEFLQNVRWQFRRLNDTLALFDEIQSDPAFFNTCRIPFLPDSGEYAWRVRFRNNFGEWGPWSGPGIFSQPLPSLPFFTIQSITATEPGKKNPLDRLTIGEWVHVHVGIRARVPWKDLGYMILTFSHPDYPHGHPGNKGGAYVQGKNYVINLSQGRDFSSHFIEKRRANSLRSDPVPENGTGLYLDAAKKEILVDTSNGIIRVKFRLPEEAIADPAWIISAYIVGSGVIFEKQKHERISGIFKQSMPVLRKPTPRLLRRLIPGLLFVIACVIGTALIRKRAKRPQYSESKMKQDWDTLVQWIDTHISENKLYTDEIREKLGFPRRYFQLLLKENGVISPVDLVNNLRIKRAKKLLAETGKPVSDIAYEVGITDISYFGKLFKNKTGRTPKEFRNLGE